MEGSGNMSSGCGGDGGDLGWWSGGDGGGGGDGQWVYLWGEWWFLQVWRFAILVTLAEPAAPTAESTTST
eukprot:11868728-Karenia_brevis.AAC.1